ncbi:unnamed protein product [Periconia digitata]|uniref:Manganese/iron superoxide dismutase C-terminal domain-containing protein n=1 Tax=Periconia digitata TaxID=1303443 RepID=A0A9W4UVU6_9PLEO|nr:unnamed protein product [Periconia digitata]
MIIRSLARRPNAIPTSLFAARHVARPSPFATPASSFAPLLARSHHKVPALDNHAELQANGIPSLLSPRGFDIAYTQYHQHILDELNIITDGTPDENQDVKSLAVNYARDPTKAYQFNLASMAFNNHFFFSGINATPGVDSIPSQDLVKEIKKHFSNSMDTFKDDFIGTAEAMFGPGFVWLVQTKSSEGAKMKILTTYLAGSPLSGAHYRKQSHDLNTENADSYLGLNPAGTFGQYSSAQKSDKKPASPLGGVDVTPILCVNTWEHVWLHDYGVRGKVDYLENWWNKIDWNKALQFTNVTRDSSSQFQQGGARKFTYADHV